MSKTRDYEALLYWNGDEQQLDKIRSAKDDRAKWKLLMDALEETHMTILSTSQFAIGRRWKLVR